MIYLIDTNIFLRGLIKEDLSTFKDSINFLKKVKENKVKAVTTHLILAELAWTLSSFYKVPKKEVILSIKSIINLRGVDLIDSYDINLAISIYEKLNVKFIDSMIASIRKIQNKEWAIISYDKDFDKIGVTRCEPGDI